MHLKITYFKTKATSQRGGGGGGGGGGGWVTIVVGGIMEYVNPFVIAGNINLVPVYLVCNLQVIATQRKNRHREFHLRVPDLNVSYTNLTKLRGYQDSGLWKFPDQVRCHVGSEHAASRDQ